MTLTRVSEVVQRESRSMPQAQPVVVVNIVAMSYAGSTWANMLLGANSEAFSIGEMDRIQKYEQATCTIHGPECPVWSRFDRASDENIFLQISRISGKRFLVVNNTRKYLEC
ncbi:MAG: hypothetical protein O7G85_03215 [Planctomycetota bacterium]|nr:hypothetical protein [Planctomycetota bacterium]